MASLKKVLNAGNVTFVKEITNFGEYSLNGDNLKFTYCDVNDLTNRPYGNLFSSFNLPILDNQKNDFNANNINNAFKYFSNIENVIVAEIPENTYGELIDGKTFKMSFPINSGMTQVVVDCYGNYFLNDEIYNTKDYDKKYADSRLESVYFGINPNTPDNTLKSSNVAYLFCNDIAKPKLNLIYSTPTYVSTNPVDFTAVTTSNYSYFTDSFSFQKGNVYNIILTEIYDQNNKPETNEISKLLQKLTLRIGNNSFDFPNDGNNFNVGGTGANTYTIRNIEFVCDKDESFFTIKSELANNRYIKNAKISIGEINFSEGSWSRWTNTNKFTSTTIKQPAKFIHPFSNLLIDQPVGILYLDKGFAVITDPTLVSNFAYDYSGATSSGYDLIEDGQQYTGDTNFTQIYFNDPTKANAIYNSIYTEFIQSVTCIAEPNEFYISNNPTFVEVYGENGENNINNDPVYITEVGLYNKYGELIAIAKTSEPIPKDKFNIAAFNIKLKL
jgi:hypothetical protein